MKAPPYGTKTIKRPPGWLYSLPAVIVTGIVINLVLVLVLCLPRSLELKYHLQEVNSLEKEYHSLADSTSSSHLSERDMVEIAEKSPPDGDIPGFLLDLSAVEKATGAQIASIDFLDQNKNGAVKSGLKELPAAMEVKGNYSQLYAFLGDLYRLNRLVVVKGIRLDGQNGGGEMDLNINFSLYAASGFADVLP